jgi:hexosaminidase
VGAHDADALRTARWLSALALRSRGLRLVPTSVAGRAWPRIVLVRHAGPAESEAYKINIGRGAVTVRASSDAGLLYGAVTLWQLITAEEGRGPLRLASLRLEDQPRFAWRGLLLDSARHMQSAAFIERMIDWMALHKLNILQWHLTDDEGPGAFPPVWDRRRWTRERAGRASMAAFTAAPRFAPSSPTPRRET